MDKEKEQSQEADLDQELLSSVQSLQQLAEKYNETDLSESEGSEESLEATSEPDDVKEVEASEEDTPEVPIKNRLAEANRKLQRQEERLAELEAKLAQVATPQSTDNTLDTLTGVPFYQSAPVQQASQQAVDESREPSYATREEVLQLTQAITAKRAADEAALQRFPDLKNPGSLLYKETQARIQAARQMGASPFAPNLVLHAAEAAFGSLIAKGSIKLSDSKTKEEAARREAVDSSALPITRSGKPRKSADSKALSDMEKFTLSEFRKLGVNITKDDYLSRKKKYTR